MPSFLPFCNYIITRILLFVNTIAVACGSRNLALLILPQSSSGVRVPFMWYNGGGIELL